MIQNTLLKKDIDVQERIRKGHGTATLDLKMDITLCYCNEYG